MPGFKPAVKKSGKASGKAAVKPGHTTSAKPGGCGTGAGGFQAGNTCGHKGNRNQKVEAARAAHTAAKNDVLKHVKAHRKATKAAAKAGESAPAPKELHAAIKKAAAAHGELKDARDTHRAEQRDKRNVAAKERRAVKAGKAQPLTARPKAPAREGQARPSQTDRPSRNDRLAVLAARHDIAAKRLAEHRDESARHAYTRQTLAGRGNNNPESATERGRYADSHAIGRRAQIHKETAERLRESIHDPAKSGAAARTLKSLSGNPVGSRANVDAIRATAGKLTHAEMKAAATGAGLDHGGSRNRYELRDHLLRTVGKAPEPVAPPKPSPGLAPGRGTPERQALAKKYRETKVAYLKTKAAYDAAVAREKQTPQPSPERRAFGAGGRDKADPADVADYDRRVKEYSAAHRAYLKAAKESLGPSNAHHYTKQEIRARKRSR